MRELARVCTFDMFYRFLNRHHMIYDELDKEWVDFDFGDGITSCIGYDSDGTPYLSDYVQYWDEDEEETFEFEPLFPIYFRNTSQT